MHTSYHLDESTIVAYLDGELLECRRRVESHLDKCPVCSATLADLRKTSQVMYALQPPSTIFSSDGAFWTQLAANLGAQKQATWSLVGVIPTIAISVVGTILHGLASLILYAYVVVSLGLWPSASQQLGQWMDLAWIRATGRRIVDISVDWPLGDKLDQALRAISGVGQEVQEALLVSMVLGMIGMLSAVVLAIWFSWFFVSQQAHESLQFRR